MNAKGLARHQAGYLLKCLAPCYAVYFGVLLVVQLAAPGHDPLGMPFRMLGAVPALFALLIGTSVGIGDIAFLLQNGLSRRQVFAHCVASLAATTLVMALIETLCTAFVPFWTGQSAYFLIRGESDLAVIFAGVLLSNFVLALGAFSFVALTLRSHRATLVATTALIAVSVTALALTGSIKPVMDVVLVFAGLGFDGEGTSTTLITTMGVEAAALLAAAFAILRTIEVKRAFQGW